jgi:hypothetical protein
VRCYPDTIDYKRSDTFKLMKEMGKEHFSAYYTGSVWVNESKGTVGAGDVVVPIEKTDEMVKKLRDFGCPPAYVHRHPEFKTAHIHLSDCPIRDRVREFARLVSF